MARAHAGIPQQYQQPMWGTVDPVLKRCFIAAGILGVAALVVIFLAPALPPRLNTLEEMPDRLARLILEKPQAPAGEIAERIAKMEAPKAEARPEEKPAEPATPKAEPRRRSSPPRVATDKGALGREKAKTEVAQSLAQVTSSVDNVLESVAKSLPATASTDEEATPRRRRAVRSGRSGTQIASVGGTSSLAAPEMGGSAIESEGISIAAITDLAVDGNGGGDGMSAPDAGGSTAAGGARNDHRSNESLLAVVRRYAPGIQFCYDNELKRNPGLRGKLVVSITVLANGAVSEAVAVEDRLGSPAVTQCVLAQIRGWRFPAIPDGTTSFKTPFVFTPPN